MKGVGWIKRRAREIMRTFNAPRAKAVRYAADLYRETPTARRNAMAERNAPVSRTCAELGVCQARRDCLGCAYPFAPGVIEVHHRSTPAMRDFKRFLSRATGSRSF